jgi:hypothetical protein
MKYILTIKEVCEILKEDFKAQSCILINPDYNDRHFELDVKTRAIPSKDKEKETSHAN